MRNAFSLDRPSPRAAGDVGRWVEVAAWLLAFALLLAGPCATSERQPGADGDGGHRQASVSALPGAAPRPR